MTSNPTLPDFVTRDRCLVCSGSDLVPTWSARFRDGVIPDYIAACKYSEDIMPLLGDASFTMVACSRCEMAFQRSILSEPALETLYSRWIDANQIAVAEQRRDRFESTRQFVKNVLRLQRALPSSTRNRPPRILDYGCGSGDFLVLCGLFGWEAHGIDLSTTRRTQSLTAGVRIHPDFAAIDEAKAPPFDAATLFQVLEHVPDPAALLQEIVNRLAPTGVLLIEVPDTRGITVPKNLDEFLVVHPLEHINAFTPKTLRALGERCGLRMIPRAPAHATTGLVDVAKTEVTRLYQPPSTQQFFVRRRAA